MGSDSRKAVMEDSTQNSTHYIIYLNMYSTFKCLFKYITFLLPVKTFVVIRFYEHQ